MADLSPHDLPGSDQLPVPPAVYAYEFGRFRLSIAARQLQRDGEVLLITSKAFDTLLLLISRRDRAVTKEELMQAVWPGAAVSDDSLTQAISSVRRALGDSECIATIPRRGYKFIVPVTEILAADEGASSTAGRSDETRPNGGAAVHHVGMPEMDQAARTLPTANDRAAGAGTQPRRSPGAFVLLLVLLVGLAGGTLLGLWQRPAPAPGVPMRFTQQPPAGTRIVSGGVVSPDGRFLAFLARELDSRLKRIWVRELDSDDAVPLAGSDNAERPFWSPDSQSIGFAANGQLKAISVKGDNLRDVAVLRGVAAGASWGPQAILFSNLRAGLDSVAPWGGAVSPVTRLDAAAGEFQHRWPHFLPDRRHYLFHVASTESHTAGIYVGVMGSPERTRLLDGTHEAAIFSPPNHLVYVREGVLMGQRFHPGSLRLEGEPTTLDAQVTPPGTRNTAMFSVGGGLLAYGGGQGRRRLTWFDRRGTRLSTIETPTALFNPVLSSDEKQLLAVSIARNHRGVWLIDLERGVPNRLVPNARLPMFSPDDASVAYVAAREPSAVNDVFLRRLDGSSGDEALLRTKENKYVNDWTRDGRYIILATSNATTGEDVWVLPTFGDRQPFPYLVTEFNEIQARVSPDGKWLAYASNESGTWEVYVQTFPVPGGRHVISTRGGAQPVWRSDGQELFYMAEDRTLMSVGITTSGKALQIRKPEPLFSPRVAGNLNHYRSHYAPSADGQRFIVDALVPEAHESIKIISNWTALLDR